MGIGARELNLLGRSHMPVAVGLRSQGTLGSSGPWGHSVGVEEHGLQATGYEGPGIQPASSAILQRKRDEGVRVESQVVPQRWCVARSDSLGGEQVKCPPFLSSDL